MVANSKLAVFWALLLFGIVCRGFKVDAQDAQVIEEVRSDSGADSSALKAEFEQLKSKIQLLGSLFFSFLTYA